MTDSSPGYQQFFAELKRRKVFRVMAVYGIVGFVLLQIVDLAVPALLLPEWTYRLVALILLLGFPVAIILAWAFEMTPEGVQKTQAAAPGELGAIIAAPASQRWPAGLLALVGMAALVLGAWWVGTQTPSEPDATAGPASADVRLAFTDLADDPRPSLAVLPFADMSPEGDQEYFSDGITEEILNTLARIKELKVAARTSAFAFKGRLIDMRVVGDSLGVAYLIEGSVRKAGNQLRITAQLIDAADGTHLWSDQYDRRMGDVFAIQTEIAQAIAEQLRVPLGLDDPKELVTPTADFEAYDLYLAGLAQMRTRGAAVAEAVRLFEAAITRDSSWAPAWARLAEARETLIWYREGWDDPPADYEAYLEMALTVVPALLEEAEQAARQALVLDPNNASAHVALGSVMRDWRRWQESEEEHLRALALDPDNAEAHQEYAEYLESTGREAEALKSYGRAVALDPAPIRRGLYGFSLFMNDRPEEAVPILRQALSDSGDLPIISDLLVAVLLAIGEYESAAQFLIEAGYDAAKVHDLKQALEAGDAGLLSDETRARLSPTEWMLLGQPDRAAEALTLEMPLFDVGDWHRFDPRLDPIQDTPEMRDYLRRSNLEGVQVQRAPRPGDEATP